MIFNRETLLDFFNKLDKELIQPVELYVIGGAAASIAFNAKEGTRDIDTWLKEEKITEAYNKVVSKFEHLNIPLNPAHVHIKSPNIRKRFCLFEKEKYKNLKLFFPEAEDLFLLKAQRADEKDIFDLKALHKKNNCKPDLILKRFKNDILPQNYGSNDLLKIRYLMTIAEVFGENIAEKHEQEISSI